MAGVDWSVAGRRLNNRRRSSRSGHDSTKRRPMGMWMMFLTLWLIVGLMQGALGAAAGDRTTLALGDTSRMISCPPLNEITPCSCRVISKGLDISCDHADEKHVRNALDVLKKKHFTIYWMKFRNCNLQRLPDYVFLGLDVRHLNIIRSNVSVLERSSLSALGSTLESLDLATNHIREVPTAALSTLKALKFLNLNYNQIQVLNEAQFMGLSVLERLSLYENKIQHIHDNAFRGIGRRLIRLNLGKNALVDIPTNTFHPLTNLEVLDLHENRISHIPDSAFKGLHKLDMLKLEHNQISTIQSNVFSDLTVLNSLNIEHNEIVNISNRAFAGLESNLEWLELGHNKLDHIPAAALQPLHNLRQLDLDSNRITQVQVNDFSGYGDTIKYILLDKNHIKSIPTGSFDDLHSLEWLKLSHNDIQMLSEETVKPILDTLTMIDISNNPLRCDCDLLWLWRWLSNPHNKDSTEVHDDPMCTTQDHKSHVIQNLPGEGFNCPLQLPTQVPPVMQATTKIWPTTRTEIPTSSVRTITDIQTVKSPNSADVIRCSPILTLMAIVSTFL